MVGNARFVNVKLLTRKLGVIEINIVLNIFVRFVFPKYGFKYRAAHASHFFRFRIRLLRRHQIPEPRFFKSYNVAFESHVQ